MHRLDLIRNEVTRARTDRLIWVRIRLRLSAETSLLSPRLHDVKEPIAIGLRRKEVVATGKIFQLELARERNLSGLLKDRQKNYLTDQPWNREHPIDRSDLMLAAMFHDSQSTLSSERALSNDPLHDLDLSGQLALQRPMLVARIKRAGARLDLDKRSSAPKIEQLTLVRIILPLKKKAKS